MDSFAQEQAQEGGLEYGIHFGRFLPAGIDGITEIMPMWGLTFGGGVNQKFFEGGFLGGNAFGAKYSSLYAGLRLDMPVEQLLGTISFGLQLTSYETDTGIKQDRGGGYIGGGVMSQLDPDIWLRIDMKFSSTPGSGLYFGLGFVIR